jgi:hypothetical protein
VSENKMLRRKISISKREKGSDRKIKKFTSFTICMLHE